MRLDLTLTMRDIYINFNLNQLTKYTSSRRSTDFKGIFPWNISQMIAKIISISTRIVISYTMKWDILFWLWKKVNGNWNNNIVRISQMRKSYWRINTSVGKKKFKRAGQSESQSGIWVGKLMIWVMLFKIINRVHQVYQFHQNKLASPYDGR